MPRLHPAAPDATQIALAERIVASQPDPEAAFALTGDKALMFSDDGRGFVMFGVHGRSWIALGGPVGPPDVMTELGWAFVDAARRAGGRPMFYEVGERHLPLMLDLGLSLHKLGERGVIDLQAVLARRSARKKLRSAHARAERDGLTMEIVLRPTTPPCSAELRAISDSWLVAKKTREKRFSVGRFDAAWLGRWPMVLSARTGGRWPSPTC